jgi:TfoX/Sxy family transcriptional regulator of competence genes
MSYLLEELRGLVVDAAGSLPRVEERKLFGCAAWFASDSIFALVWKHGRIGLKLPDEAAYRELMAVAGSAPWSIGPKIMGGWVLVPEDWHDDGERLRAWAKKAHAQALSGPAPAQKKAKKKPTSRSRT